MSLTRAKKQLIKGTAAGAKQRPDTSISNNNGSFTAQIKTLEAKIFNESGMRVDRRTYGMRMKVTRHLTDGLFILKSDHRFRITTI